MSLPHHAARASRRTAAALTQRAPGAAAAAAAGPSAAGVGASSSASSSSHFSTASTPSTSRRDARSYATKANAAAANAAAGSAPDIAKAFGVRTMPDPQDPTKLRYLNIQGEIIPPPEPKKTGQPQGALPPLARSQPDVYHALLPHRQSTLTALMARLGLPTTDAHLVEQFAAALTHHSWCALRDRQIDGYVARQAVGFHFAAELEQRRSQARTAAIPEHSAHLVTLGNTLFGLFASEQLHLQYPNLPNRVLKAAVSSYVGPNTLADVAVEMGLGARGVVKYDKTFKVRTKVPGHEEPITSREVLSSAMRAILALTFKVKGMAAARAFVTSNFLTRLPLPPVQTGTSASPVSSTSSHPLAPMLKFDNPKRTLRLLMVTKYGMAAPESRLIAETGRLTNSPVFGVGMYAGTRKIGEGWGSAIKMAEYRAAEDALRRLYLAQAPPLAKDEVPSATLDTASPLFAGSMVSSAEAGAHAADAASSIPSTSAHKDIWEVGQPVDKGGADDAPYRPRKIGESEIVDGSRNI